MSQFNGRIVLKLPKWHDPVHDHPNSAVNQWPDFHADTLRSRSNGAPPEPLPPAAVSSPRQRAASEHNKNRVMPRFTPPSKAVW